MAKLDWLLRGAFFLAAPFVLVRVATLVPIAGILIDVGLAFATLVFGEALRGRAGSNKVVRYVFDRGFAFEDFYRAEAPRGFWYYALYPLLFPYWLVNRKARREFLLFKGYTLVAMLVLVLTNAYSFFFRYRPELGFRDFVAPLILGLIVESTVVLGLLMPIVTTIFSLHRAGARSALRMLIAVGALSTAAGIARLVVRQAPLVSFETRHRVVLRTQRASARAQESLALSVRAAREALVRDRGTVHEDGTVDGPPREVARRSLATFYRSDEAAAFDLWTSNETEPRFTVLYAEGRRERRPIWVGVRDDGSLVKSVRELPREARSAMKEVGEF